MHPILHAALHLRAQHFSVIPIDASKKSILYWQKYQHCLINPTKLAVTLAQSHCYGIAVVCGEVSGLVEGIDLDNKNDPSGTLYQRFTQAILNFCPEVLKRLVIVSTRNKGYHFWYRCRQVGPSDYLAKRPATALELRTHPKQKLKVLIERRSRSAYLIVPPTPGYQFLQGNLSGLSWLTPEERGQLEQIGRSFNESTPDAPLITPVTLRPHDPLSPFAAYDNYPDISEILSRLLQNHGWLEVGPRKGPRIYFRRPGETDHDTSGNYHIDLRLFKAFTTSTEFEYAKAYRPHAVFAILECHHDFKLAARTLLAMGFGVPYCQR